MPYVFFKCDKCQRKLNAWQEQASSIPCTDPALIEPGEEFWCKGTLLWYRVVYGDPPSRNARPFDAVVLFRDPTAPEGEYRTPGWNDEATPAGFQRVEIRSIREWEQVTKQMSAAGRRKAEEAYYERQEAIGKVKAELHAELRREMQHFDGPMRQFAAAALERSEARKGRPMPSGEVVAHALEYDSSNREAWRDQRTGWKGRRS